MGPKKSTSLPYFHFKPDPTSPSVRGDHNSDRHEQRHLAAFAEAFDLDMALPKGFLQSLQGRTSDGTMARPRSSLSRLQEGFIVNTDWTQEEAGDPLRQSLAKQKMSDQAYDRALVEQEERSRRMPYELATSTRQARQSSHASDTSFLDTHADELHDRLNAMKKEATLKSEKLHAMELELQECKQLSETVDASSRLDALNGMDDRLRDALLRLQHEEQMLQHMRRRLEENNYNLSRRSEAMQGDLKKCNSGTEKLMLYRDQLEAAQQHSETSAKQFKHYLEVERGTRAKEVERRRGLAAQRKEEDRMNVKRLARQLHVKDPEDLKAEAVTNILDVSAENHRKQQQMDERRTYEAEMKRVEQASGVTDIAQVVDRYEHIHESAAALHEGRRQVEARKSTLMAALKQSEKTRADMELVGVKRDPTVDDSISKLEHRLDVQEGRVEESRRRLATIVPLLQGIGSGCRTMQRMLGLNPLAQLLPVASEEKTMLTELPPSRPGTAPAGSDDALRAFNSRRQIALNASDATLDEGSFSRDPEEVARYEMDRAELGEFAESVATLARIESELTRGALRNYLKPRQPGEPMTRAEAAVARDADKRGLQSNPDNLRVVLDADGLVTFGQYLGGLEVFDDGGVPDRPEDKAEKEITFNRLSQWKVNPVVHPSRGVLGYARTPVRDGKAPTGAPIVFANGLTPPPSKRKSSIAGERRGGVRIEGSTSLPTLAPGTVPVGEDQLFSRRASVPRSEPRRNSVKADLRR